MKTEEHYKQATESYLELLDFMIQVAKDDPETTEAEVAYVTEHRDFTALVLERINAEIAGSEEVIR